VLSEATLKLSQSKEGKEKKRKASEEGKSRADKKNCPLAVAGFWKPLEGKASNRAADLNRFSSLFFLFPLSRFASLHIQARS
jgi:hypothetical protein